MSNFGPRNKSEFYRMFYRGRFGNKGLIWRTLQDFQDSGYKNLVAIRTLGVGTRCDYDIPSQELPNRYREFQSQGWKADQLNISAMMQDDQIVIQGEVCRSFRGFELLYSEVQKPMRRALAIDSKRANGLAAQAILKSRMDADSFDWLSEMLDNYHHGLTSSSVIEFSTYRVPVGELRGRNTIFWEVRNY